MMTGDDLRRRAVTVFCAGLALIAVDWRVVPELAEPNSYVDRLHALGLLFLAAVGVALVGLYHWILGPPRR